MRRYEGTVYDSDRWDGFKLRPGDIIIAPPPKCGTTWTQMVCALLILQEPELPLPLDRLSPWIDMVTRARAEVFADLQAQTHRRLIKTHTPLDGIPNDPTVTYISVGRDPRDVALSIDRHIDNTDRGAFLIARERAAAIDGIELEPLRPTPPRPEGERDRFWQWVDDETPSTHVGSSLRRTLEHLQTFRAAGNDLDVVYLHYDDPKTDHGLCPGVHASHLVHPPRRDRYWTGNSLCGRFDAASSTVSHGYVTEARRLAVVVRI